MNLDRLLEESEEKPARKRLTLVRVFEALRGLAYGDSYDAVRRYAYGLAAGARAGAGGGTPRRGRHLFATCTARPKAHASAVDLD